MDVPSNQLNWAESSPEIATICNADNKACAGALGPYRAKGDSKAAVDKCSKKLPHGTTEDRTERTTNIEVQIEGNCRIKG